MCLAAVLGARVGEADLRGPKTPPILAREASLESAEGQIVSTERVGLVTVESASARAGAFELVLGHELGHFILHPGHDDFRRCLATRSRSGTRDRENEANDFSAESLMPRRMVRQWATQLGERAGECIDHVRELGSLFSAPVESAALRMLLFADVPCAAVFSSRGRVKWWARTATFPAVLPYGARVGAETIAARLHGGGGGGGGAQRVRVSQWDRSTSEAEVVEEAVRVRGRDEVLTWLVEPSVGAMGGG